MDSESLRFLVAENARLRAHAAALQDQLTKAAQDKGRGRSAADLFRSELLEKLSIQFETTTRASLFASAEALRATADVIGVASEQVRQHQTPTLSAELAAAPRRIMQKFFDFYRHPYTPPHPAATRVGGSGRTTR